MEEVGFLPIDQMRFLRPADSQATSVRIVARQTVTATGPSPVSKQVAQSAQSRTD